MLLTYPSLSEQPFSAADPLVPTIFHESWWLDIVTGGQYEVAEVSENGKTVGRLPYFPRSRFGLKYSILPPMTHFLGPAIVEGVGSHPTRFLRNAMITRELIQQLPPASLYRYKCHRDITDTIAFQQEGFHTRVQFTHEIPPAAEEILWKNLRGKKRKKIRRARENVIIGQMSDPQEFWHWYDTNLRLMKKQNLCDKTLICTLIDACLSRGTGNILTARDSHNQLLAALFCVRDHTSSYYFMSTRCVGVNHDAISLLAWEAMRDASARGLIFDFDGLSSASGVLFFTEFGGVISPRYVVTRNTLMGSIALGIKDMFRESRYFY